MRRSLSVLAVAVCAVLLTACTPAPSPSPSPSATGFASDEEAFAAAEATYRAYVDALNQVDLADPATFEPVYGLTTGELRSSEKKTLTEMHSKGWIVAGASEIARIDRLEWTSDGSVVLGACVDVSTITLVNADGESQVGVDRPLVQSLSVLVERAKGATQVAKVEGSPLEPPCS